MHQCCLSKQPGDVVEVDVGVEVEEVVEVLDITGDAVDIDVIDDVEDGEEAKVEVDDAGVEAAVA